MTTQDLPETHWQTIARLLRSEGGGLRGVYPDASRRLSLLDALSDENVAVTAAQAQSGREIGHRLHALLDQLAAFENLSRCPILAITGLLNAGKSSLLATYLSPQNQARVLRGLDNRAGTHRFVLWLPQVWAEQPELLKVLVDFLTALFGHAPEQLAEDPQLAAMQYNGHIEPQALLPTAATEKPATEPVVAEPVVAERAGGVDPLSVPLLAYDTALDELRMGLIDCPDIQTGFFSASGDVESGMPMAAARRGQLSRIGRLCSAFIIVSKLSSLHDEGLLQILSTLRDAMPGVPRMLAVNKIKARYGPEVVYEQARGLVDRFGLQAVFAAYDYRSSLAQSRLPPPPPRMKAAGSEVPLFFQIGAHSPAPHSASAPVVQGATEGRAADTMKRARERDGGDAGESAADSGQAIRYLFDLGQRLDVGALSRATSRSLMVQLKAQASAALEWLEANQRLSRQQIQDARQAIADACYEFMAERNPQGQAVGLRLQASPAIVSQMADSLRRTAPLWMRVSLNIDRTARQFQQAVSNSAGRIKILQSASQSVAQFTKKFRRGEGAQVVTPQRLAEEIRNVDRHDALQHVPQEQLVAGCTLAIKRFAAEDKTLLPDQELDAWSRQVWAGMSVKDKLWKGTQPLAVLLAPLLAAVLVPIDGGGTAVLVFASTKELLAAAGIAALMAPMATGGEALSIVHRETPWRQLSDLFAIACDSLGLPRPTESELPCPNCQLGSRRLLASTLAIRGAPTQAATYIWQLDEPQRRTLQLQLQSAE